MVIMLTGTPAAAGTSSQIDCLDEAGEPFKLVLRVIAPTDSGTANCYLKRYDRDGTCTMLALPNIQSIEETDTANLTEISTIIYGFDNNFVMDLGTTQRFTVTLKRVQPMPSSDPQRNVGETDAQFWSRVNYAQSANWSNGFWYDALVHFIDGWQNLNYGFVTKVRNNQTVREFMQTGGFTFHFKPQEESFRGEGAIYSDLYPVIDKNVFIAGQIGMSYSGSNLQYLNISLPLAVSTMVRNQAGQAMKAVKYYRGKDDQTCFETAFPQDSLYTVAPLVVPELWLTVKNGAILMGWNKMSNPGISATPDFSPGGTVPNDINEMYALWKQPYAAYYDDASGSSPAVIQITDTIREHATALKYILVGHGGNGGHGLRQGMSYYANGYGGGGGSGGYRTGSIKLNHYQFGNVVQITLSPTRSLSDDTTLTIEYQNGQTYSLTTGNGKMGYNATGRLTDPTPGRGGAAGPNGSPGGTATSSAGGVGGNLQKYLDHYIVQSVTGTIGPFTSTSGSAPTYGGGHDGVHYLNESSEGANGLVIAILY